MMKKYFRLFLMAAVFVSAVIFTSCESIIGYSVLLWNDEAHKIEDGTVVPVFIKSNISKVYVIAVPGTDEKLEVPLWMLTEPDKKSKTIKRAAIYADYQGKYATCSLDGLPIRAEKVNTSKQVYRLRKGEIIRVLYEGTGTAPTNGKQALEGKWLRVMTSSGVDGWCFSHYLRLFKMNADGTYGSDSGESSAVIKDSLIENVLSKKWYPDYYPQMIKDKEINLNNMRADYGFDSGITSGTLSINIPALKVSYKYAGTTKKDEGLYDFNGTPVQLGVYNENMISVTYKDNRGMPKSYVFVTLPEDTDIEKLISNEERRRATLYEQLRGNGPAYKSSYYGTLTFNSNNVISWINYSHLVPQAIPSGVKNTGTASIKYELPNNLKKEWDGVLSVRLDGMTKDLNLLYKSEANGLRMSVANINVKYDDANNLQAYTVNLPVNSVVMFFQK